MIITILEAQLPSDKAALLQTAYGQQTAHLDAGIAQTYLLRGARDPSQWRILTVWESREALEAMRSSGETPRGVVMFREAGAEPVLSIFEVLAQAVA